MKGTSLNSVGVVIQGPIVSVGRTGATSVVPFNEVRPEHVVTYDCRSNVAGMVSRYADSLQHIVCTTWDDEDTGDLADRIGNARLLRIADTTPRVSAKGRVIPGNNKYRQFLSTLAGLRALKDAGCAYAIKVRTDQNLDLVTLRDRVLSDVSDRYTDNRILFPGCRWDKPTRLPDFYFGGRTETMIDVLEHYVQSEEFHENVHLDLFFKTAWRLQGRSLGQPEWAYRPSGFYTARQKAVIQSAWRNCYGTFPQKVFETLSWRGESFPASSLSANVYAETSVADRDAIVDREVTVSAWRHIRSRMKYTVWFPVKGGLRHVRGRLQASADA